MSFYYDGSGGNIIFNYNTISSIINYQFPPLLTISLSISEYIFPSYPTISGYVYGSITSRYTTISSSLYNLRTDDWLNDKISNRYASTFMKGFLSLSGNLSLIHGSIYCNENFNSIPVSYFNQLLHYH